MRAAKQTTIKTLIVCTILLISTLVEAQAPGLVNYQGNARRTDGTSLINRNLGIKFELRLGSATATAVFTETQTVQTNNVGLFSTQIGKTAPLGAVNLDGGNLFLQTSIDTTGGTNFVDLAVQQLVSVPYALYSQSVPSSFTNNILTIGSKSYTFASVVNNSYAQGTNVTISGTAPNFTISSTPTLSLLSPNTLSISGGNTVDIAPTLSFVNNVLTVGPATNTITIASPNTSLTSSGAGTITSTGTNSFNINVPQTSLTGIGTTTVTGAFPNYTINSSSPTSPQGTLTSTGIGTVTSAGTNSFNLNIPQTNLNGTGGALVTGAFPNYTINAPAAQPQGTLTSAGIATVTTVGTNSFNVNVATPSFTGIGSTTVTGSYPNYTINSSSPTSPQGTLTSSGIGTITPVGTNSFNINIPQTNLNSAGAALVTGSFPNYTISAPAAQPQGTLTSAGIVTVTPVGTNSFNVNVATPSFTGIGSTTVTGSYPNYTINSSSPTSPQGTLTSSGIGTITPIGTNSFNINIPQTNLNSAGAALVTGSFPNYTISAPAAQPQGTVTSTGIATVTTAGTNSFNVNVPQTNLAGIGAATVTGSFPNYTINAPAQIAAAQGTLTSTGIGTVTTAGTNSFNINVPQTNLTSAGAATVTGSFPNYTINAPAQIATPQSTLTSSGIGTVTSAGTNSFNINIPATPQATITSSGIGTVTTAGTNSFNINVPQTNLTSAGAATVTGSFPNYTINAPAQIATPQATITSSGIGTVTTAGTNSFNINIPATPQATITSSGIGTVTTAGTNSFNINVPQTNLTSAGAATVTGSFPNYTINAPAQIATPQGTITSSGIGTVTTAGTNSFNINVPQTNLTSTGAATVTGTFPNYTVNAPAATPNTSITGLGTTTVTGTFPNYTVNTAAQPQTTVTSTGIGTITSAGTNSFNINIPAAAQGTITSSGIGTVTTAGTNSFNINVPQTNLTSAGAATVTGSFPNYTINAPAQVTAPQGTLTSSGIGTITTAGTNSFNVNIPQTNLTGAGTTTVSGSFPNYTVATAAFSGWGLTGNLGTSTVSNFIGTTDNQPLQLRVNGQKSGLIDHNWANTFYGYRSGNVTTGSGNTGFGNEALILNTTGFGNAAIGHSVLYFNTTGYNNTGVGQSVMYLNTTGVYNVGVGSYALSNNATGNFNTAIGTNALQSNTVSFNTAVGYAALQNNISGVSNTGIGYDALRLTTGANNTGIGYGAGNVITTGNNNIFLGAFANASTGNLNNATAIGFNAIVSASNRVKLGSAASVEFDLALMPNGLAGTSGQVLQSTGPGAAPVWTTLASTGWGLTGNAGTSTLTNFIGTTDNNALSFRVFNNKAGKIDNNGPTFFGYMAGNTNTVSSVTGIGYQALAANTTGSNNCAVGYYVLAANTTGYNNTANGSSVLYNNTTGYNNTAVGYNVMAQNSTGYENTAVGYNALVTNSTGQGNTAVGALAMTNNITGRLNTSSGYMSLTNNGAGSFNTSSGSHALFANSTGSYNAAVGVSALFTNTSGNNNTASGYSALTNNSVGQDNTSTGYSSLYSTTTGSFNTADGSQSMYSNTTGSNNVAQGWQAGYLNTTGSKNTFLGSNSNASANNLTNASAIGANATVTASNKVKLGNAASVEFDLALMPGGNAGTSGQILQSSGAGAAPVWTTASSAGWGLTGNAGTSASTNFIGTTDNVPLCFRVTGQNAGRIDHILQNVFLGHMSGQSNTTGNSNIGIGTYALFLNTTGTNNSASGFNSLYYNSNGASNTANGSYALYNTTSGSFNTSMGESALYANVTGQQNVAHGRAALYSSTGSFNSAIGSAALYSNAGGQNNTAVGFSAGFSSANATGNVFLGSNAGYFETGSNKLYISNSTTSVSPLIMGDFSTGRLGINKITPTEALDVTGNVRLSGALMPNNLAGTAGQLLQSSGAGVAPVWTTVASSDWGLTGNAGTNASTNFIGTSDNVALKFRVNNTNAGSINNTSQNVFFGYQSGNVISTGVNNTGMGQNALLQNTTGNDNTAIGNNALQGNIGGTQNVALGNSALRLNTSGINNTSTGYGSLFNNTTGASNAAYATYALYSNVTGIENTAMGIRAMFFNTIGSYNTSLGASALYNNLSGSENVAVGRNSMYNNTTGAYNVASGSSAMSANTTGQYNTANGYDALAVNTIGSKNTALGSNALLVTASGSNNVAVGSDAGYSNSTGSGNVFIGYSAGYSETSSNKLYISNSNTAVSPLIYGDFSTGKLSVNSTTGAGVLSIDNQSVTTRDGLHVYNGRDAVGSGMPMVIDAVTSGQTYGSNTYGRILRLNNATLAKFYDFGITSTGNFFIANNNNYSPAALNISTLSNVGINNASPTATLDVAGTFKLADGTQGTGKVLTSDGSGNASWATPTAVSKTRSIILEAGAVNVNGAFAIAPVTFSNVGGGQRPCVILPDGTLTQAQFNIPVPADWNTTSSFTVRIQYSSPTTTGNFDMQTLFTLTSLGQDATSGTGLTNYVISPHATTADGLMETTVVLSPSATVKSVHFSVRRNGAAGSDSSTSPMRLYGVAVDYKD